MGCQLSANSTGNGWPHKYSGHSRVGTFLLGPGRRATLVLLMVVLFMALCGCESRLSTAAGNGDVPAVQALVEAGADPSDGLVAAVMSGHVEIVQILLDAGGDPMDALVAVQRLSPRGNRADDGWSRGERPP